MAELHLWLRRTAAMYLFKRLELGMFEIEVQTYKPIPSKVKRSPAILCLEID
jgi:hypothetical protein